MVWVKYKCQVTLNKVCSCYGNRLLLHDRQLYH